MDTQTAISRLDAIIRDGRARHGAQFDPSDLAPQFAELYGNRDIRVTVERTYASGETYRRTGCVGKTTGWRPAFLLMSRVTSLGSSDVLSCEDRIVSTRPRRTR